MAALCVLLPAYAYNGPNQGLYTIKTARPELLKKVAKDLEKEGSELVVCSDSEMIRVAKSLRKGRVVHKLKDNQVFFIAHYAMSKGDSRYYDNVTSIRSLDRDKILGFFVRNAPIAGMFRLFTFCTDCSKLALLRWAKDNDSHECLVCYEDNADSSLCPVCGVTVCWKCLVDLFQVAGISKSGQTSCKCPNCRTVLHFDLPRYYRPDMDFGAANAKFVRKWTKAYETRQRQLFEANVICTKPPKPTAEERSLWRARERMIQNYCENFFCHKAFWDKAARKRAPKCGRCKRVAYCSTKCRTKDKKMHAKMCKRKPTDMIMTMRKASPLDDHVSDELLASAQPLQHMSLSVLYMEP